MTNPRDIAATLHARTCSVWLQQHHNTQYFTDWAMRECGEGGVRHINAVLKSRWFASFLEVIGLDPADVLPGDGDPTHTVEESAEP